MKCFVVEFVNCFEINEYVNCIIVDEYVNCFVVVAFVIGPPMITVLK